MEIIVSEKYKVGGYLYEDKSLALKLDKLLSENSNRVICHNCKGTRVVNKIESKYNHDTDTLDNQITESRCTTCKDGVLTKVVEVRYVK